MKKLSPFVTLEKSVVALGYPRPTSIAAQWIRFVPSYQSRNYGPAIFTVRWDPTLVARIEAISRSRVEKRLGTYLIPDEMERVKNRFWSKNKNVAIRFGHLKTGRGYNENRGDYCLTSGAIRGKDLTVYYRSLEMIGGFALDLCLINSLPKLLDVITWNTVTFVTANCFVFALKGNSNESLYPKLRRIFAPENGS